MLLKNQWVNESMKEEIRKCLKTNENENTTFQTILMSCSKSSSKREVYSDTDLPQETRKISNIQPKLLIKGIRKRRTKPKKMWYTYTMEYYLAIKKWTAAICNSADGPREYYA